MDLMYERCCGIDVHKKIIVACFKCGRKQEIREFKSTTEDLREMAKWLVDGDCQMAAMESTGCFWKPLVNVFELSGVEAIVVNARDMKNVPGRKTDVKDAEWIADLLQHGLLKASFIPDREQRELRELSRYRMSLVGERAREINRLQKVLEGGNIKLSSVVSNINGKSSRSLLKRLVNSDAALTDEQVSELVHGTLKRKTAELMKALDGFLTKTQKRLLRCIIDHIDDMTKRIEELDGMIDEHFAGSGEELARLMEIPGVGKRSAETILAETGTDMERFPSAKHLSNWGGVAPGNNESAGKKKSARTTKGNHALKTTLVQCAKAAARKAGSFFRAQYQRLAARRGANRATMAVAHSILIAIYHIIKDGTSFRDLGEDYYEQYNRERKIASYVRKLQNLGCDIKTAASSVIVTA